MTNITPRTYRLAEIELEARRLRAEATRKLFVSFGAWLRKPRRSSRPVHGRTA